MKQSSCGAVVSVHRARREVADVLASDLTSLGADELLGLLGDIEVLSRQVAAAASSALAAVESTEAHAVDGHLSARAAVKHLGRLSGPEAGRRIRRARTLTAMSEVRSAFFDGRLPVEHLDRIVTAHANPRIRSQVETNDSWFATWAADLPFDPFRALVAQYERLADEDGAFAQAELRHSRRGVFVTDDPAGGISGRFRLGDLQGEVFRTVLARFEHTEWLADWTESGEGDRALPRTPGQRRADAMVAMARAADSYSGDRPLSEPLVGILADQGSLLREIDRAAGLELEPVDPTTAEHVRCETTDGRPLPPSDVLTAALAGQVRRVVLGSNSVVIDLGRRQRLFTGGARDAVRLGRPPGVTAGCEWLDCGVPAERCQIDHRSPWRLGGATTPANGGVSCGRHNRLKETGFGVTADGPGRPTITRPDGQPTTPPR